MAHQSSSIEKGEELSVASVLHNKSPITQLLGDAFDSLLSAVSPMLQAQAIGIEHHSINRQAYAKRGYLKESNCDFHEPFNNEYLDVSFDPSTLTVPYCRELLAKHGIRARSSLNKEEICDLWVTELRPRIPELLAKAKVTNKSTSSNSSAVDKSPDTRSTNSSNDSGHNSASGTCTAQIDRDTISSNLDTDSSLRHELPALVAEPKIRAFAQQHSSSKLSASIRGHGCQNLGPAIHQKQSNTFSGSKQSTINRTPGILQALRSMDRFRDIKRDASVQYKFDAGVTSSQAPDDGHSPAWSHNGPDLVSYLLYTASGHPVQALISKAQLEEIEERIIEGKAKGKHKYTDTIREMTIRVVEQQDDDSESTRLKGNQLEVLHQGGSRKADGSSLASVFDYDTNGIVLGLDDGDMIELNPWGDKA